MRKIGIEIFYWIERWSDNQVAYFSKANDCGFDSVEISFTAPPQSLDVAHIRDVLKRFELDIYCSTGLSLETNIASEDAHVRRAGIDYLRQCLEIAQALGSPLVGGVTYAPWLYFPQESDLRAYRERSANALREVAQIASDLGMIVTLEILNRFETFMFNTVAEAQAFLAQVDHPAIKLQLDTYHMNMEEDHIADAIRQAGDDIGHFHAAASNRKLPGQGHIDWEAIRSALNNVDYTGAIVIETFPNPMAETGRTVHTWRHLVQDYDAEAQRALKFLRTHVA